MRILCALFEAHTFDLNVKVVEVVNTSFVCFTFPEKAVFQQYSVISLLI